MVVHVMCGNGILPKVGVTAQALAKPGAPIIDHIAEHISTQHC